jgi:hypothetical protein
MKLGFKAKLVMPGLDPGIYVLLFFLRDKDVDGRVKPGHDEKRERPNPLPRRGAP